MVGSLYDFLSLKNYINVASKVISKKSENEFCVAVLKVTDENSRIWSRIRIRIRLSEVRIRIIISRNRNAVQQK